MSISKEGIQKSIKTKNGVKLLQLLLIKLINYEFFKGKDPEVYKDEEWSEVAAITLDKK